MTHDFQSDIDAVQRIDAVPRILEIVCRTTGMGFAAVARVTDARWVCCAVRDEINFGLPPGGELTVETTICHEIRQHGHEVVINQVSEDPIFANHHTPAQYGFQSYISVPIILANGLFFGTLCAIDPRPARLNTPETIGAFKLYAELIGIHLDTIERLAHSEATLTGERETAELREQFIAVLGHDLRNPLASIAAGINLLARALPADTASANALPAKSSSSLEPSGIIGAMRGSVVRMAGLIDNVLDFARGRLGHGISLQCEAQLVEPILAQVVTELRFRDPDRIIETSFALDRPVTCDAGRIAQLFSNLLSNAITHGAPDQSVQVRASDDGGVFELAVTNSGPPISPSSMNRLFQPFQRGDAAGTSHGLGLGLYIASEIARAHGGSLTATSTAAETCFVYRMRLDGPHA